MVSSAAWQKTSCLNKSNSAKENRIYLIETNLGCLKGLPNSNVVLSFISSGMSIPPARPEQKQVQDLSSISVHPAKMEYL